MSEEPAALGTRYGHVQGFPIGSVFPDRKILATSGVHRPPMAGICGGAKGAESIVVSGGYEDDVDEWETIIYTGHGGNDPKTKRQVAHQQLVQGNLGLVANIDSGCPIRVIRGARGRHEFSPDVGFRYDGLYRVERFWPEAGKSGYRIYRFLLRRIEGQATEALVGEGDDLYRKTLRRKTTSDRIIRDPTVSLRVKEWHNNKCQVCGAELKTPAGLYSEAAHIIPLGKPYDGPDSTSNLLCLCPNHHKLLDRWGFSLKPDFSLVGLPGALRVDSRHRIARDSVSHHLRQFALAQA